MTIFGCIYARKELDKRRLGDVVDLFTNIEMLSVGDEKDLLGRAYEYCLMKFASMEGIIALPSQLFYSTGIPVCLWFLSRGKAQPGKTLFIDARNINIVFLSQIIH